MALIEEVDVRTRSVERFDAVLRPEEMERLRQMSRDVRRRFEGRVVWQVKTTAVGGGVAEMLRQQVGYARGSGVDCRWIVISGDAEFFRITKRLHHALHGARGDGSPIGERERQHYEQTMERNAREIDTRLRPRDLVALHDPQTAGLAAHFQRSGALVTWRCHIGSDERNEETERGWRFLRPYLEGVPVLTFSRPSYVPDFVPDDRAAIVPPSIDAFSPKNRLLQEATVRAILSRTRLVAGPDAAPVDCTFERSDGTPGRVERSARIQRVGGAPSWETPLVVQVSRWDSLKDPVGVMQGFARLVERGEDLGADLVLAGADVSAISDDPEGAAVFEQVTGTWRALPEPVRRRIHLVELPTEDNEENAVIVNALQRHSAVVVQKSLAEGFGLTVTEAMWKGRAVVASAVGGIQDQIEDDVSGVLLKDPTDLDAFAEAVHGLLADPERARHLGEAARARAHALYLDTRSFELQTRAVSPALDRQDHAAGLA